MGDSVGHWDGETFVVNVTGFNDKTWLPGPGHFHSDKLHVVERLALQPDKTIFYEATMEDPKVFTKPWQYRLESCAIRRATSASWKPIARQQPGPGTHRSG